MRNRHAIEPVAGAVQRPSCGLPATITDRFTPHGSSGRIDHVELASVGGHPFRATTNSLADTRLVRLLQRGERFIPCPVKILSRKRAPRRDPPNDSDCFSHRHPAERARADEGASESEAVSQVDYLLKLPVCVVHVLFVVAEKVAESLMSVVGLGQAESAGRIAHTRSSTSCS